MAAGSQLSALVSRPNIRNAMLVVEVTKGERDQEEALHTVYKYKLYIQVRLLRLRCFHSSRHLSDSEFVLSCCELL